MGGLWPSRAASGRRDSGRQGTAAIAQVGHHGLSFGGSGPPGHVRSQAEAPAGIRGEFKPIATRLPGVQVSELLPRTAAALDKIAVIRSLVGLRDEHSSFQNLTGFTMNQSQREGKPSFGSVIAKMQGAGRPGRPAVHRPVPGYATQALQQPGTGISGLCV